MASLTRPLRSPKSAARAANDNPAERKAGAGSFWRNVGRSAVLGAAGLAAVTCTDVKKPGEKIETRTSAITGLVHGQSYWGVGNCVSASPVLVSLCQNEPACQSHNPPDHAYVTQVQITGNSASVLTFCTHPPPVTGVATGETFGPYNGPDCPTGYVDGTGACTTPPGVTQAGGTKLTDPHLESNMCAFGMCVPNAQLLSASLNLNDTPVGYAPQKGPAAMFSLAYNHAEAGQPSSPNYGNVGPQWTHNFLGYVQDDPASAGTRVTLAARGGGFVDYGFEAGSYNGATGGFGIEQQSGAALTRVPASGTLTRYERALPDGGMEKYERLDGAGAYPRRALLTKIVDPQGNALTLNYDGSNRLTSILDAAGRSTTLTYGNGSYPLQVTRVTDPFGRHADMNYDGNGRLTGITDAIGITSTATYDTGDAKFIKKLTTPYGDTNFATGGDGNTRWLEITDPSNKTMRVESVAVGTMSAATPSNVPGGISIVAGTFANNNTYVWTKHAYALMGHAPSAPADYAKAVTYHWLTNAEGRAAPIIAATKQPLESNYQFSNYPGQSDANHVGTLAKPSAVGRVLDDGSTQIATATYNSLGNPLTVTDPVGRTTRLTYASSGTGKDIDLTKVEQKISAAPSWATIAQATYNTLHEPLTITDAAGQVTTNTYNGAGQLLTTKNALNQTVTLNYSAAPISHLNSITNANNVTAATANYLANCETSNPNHVNCDLPASVTDSEGRTVGVTRDALDRVTQRTYPDSTAETINYNFQSGPLAGTPSLDARAITDRLNRTATLAYDANRRLITKTEPVGTGAATRSTGYTYFEDGQLGSIHDPNNNVTAFGIDLQGRPTQRLYADSTSEFYEYETSTSRLRRVTDGAGQIKEFSYAADDRPTVLAYIWTQNSTPNVGFDYDPFFPRLSSIWTEDTGTTSYAYVPAGTNGALKLSSVDGPFNNDTIAYGHDALGRMNSRTVAGGNESFGFDAIGRMTSHGTGIGTFTYGYLGQTGQVASRTLNGTSISTTYGYDTNANDRRLKTITNSGATRSYTITSNPYQITSIAETAGTGAPFAAQSWTMASDKADRLLSATGTASGAFTYGYDNADNRTAVTTPGGSGSWSYNILNQQNGLGFDAAGNTTDTFWQFRQSWDGANRLQTVEYKTAPGASTYTGQTSAFQYDGLGRRLTDTERNTAGNVTSATHMLWCGNELCQVRDGADTATIRYYAEGEHNLSTGKKYVYMQDQLGSVRDTVDATNGNRAATLDYEPYGYDLRGNIASGYDIPGKRFAGMIAHVNLQRYLTQYRAYDPGTGLWQSRDPIREMGNGTGSLYNYVEGQVENRIDPSGLAGMSTGTARPGVLNLLNPISDTARWGAANAMQPAPGHFAVFAHGGPNVLEGSLHFPMSPQLLANAIVASHDYRPGMTIDLHSCETGQLADGYAQRLANALNELNLRADPTARISAVVAPNNLERMFADAGGETTVVPAVYQRPDGTSVTIAGERVPFWPMTPR